MRNAFAWLFVSKWLLLKRFSNSLVCTDVIQFQLWSTVAALPSFDDPG